MFLIFVIILVVIFLIYKNSQVKEGMGICILGMGDCGTKTQAIVKTESNTLIMTENDFNSLSENINEMVSETTINQAKSCSASINELQSLIIQDITCAEDCVITGNQSATSNLTFDCLQQSEVANKIGNQMVQEMMMSMQNKLSQEVLDKLDAAAEAASKQSAFSTASANADSETSTVRNYKSVTTNHQNIEQVLKNSVANNFKQENISTCIATTVTDQSAVAQNVKAGRNAYIALNQIASASLFADCIQKDNVGNSVSNAVMNTLGVEVVNESKIESKTEASSSAAATAENKGVIESIGDAIDGIFGSMESAEYASIASGVSLSCLIMGVLAMLFMTQGGQQFSSQAMEIASKKMKGGGMLCDLNFWLMVLILIIVIMLLKR